MACLVVFPVYGIYWAVDHFQFKRHVMNALDENPNTISNYLQARGVLESDDYLGRPLKGGEKKRLSKYLLLSQVGLLKATGEEEEEELPYGGDIRAAQQANDRKAIVQIMRARQRQQAADAEVV